MSHTKIVLPNDRDFEPNARRIVACVNATRHLSTEQLEAGDLDYAGCSTLADIRAALGVGDKPMLNELAGIVGTMKRERDEAVEALGWYAKEENYETRGMCPSEAELDCGSIARAVLAKIEGVKS